MLPLQIFFWSIVTVCQVRRAFSCRSTLVWLSPNATRLTFLLFPVRIDPTGLHYRSLLLLRHSSAAGCF